MHSFSFWKRNSSFFSHLQDAVKQDQQDMVVSRDSCARQQTDQIQLRISQKTAGKRPAEIAPIFSCCCCISQLMNSSHLQNPSFLIQNSSFLIQNSSYIMQNHPDELSAPGAARLRFALQSMNYVFKMMNFAFKWWTLYFKWWILMSFDEFWWILMSFDEFWWILMNFDEFWWVLMNFDEFWWILMNFDEFWWVLMNFDEFWWVLKPAHRSATLSFGSRWSVQSVSVAARLSTFTPENEAKTWAKLSKIGANVE